MMSFDKVKYLFRKYLTGKSYSKWTVKKYLNIVKEFFRFLTGRNKSDVRCVEKKDILEYQQTLFESKTESGEPRYSGSTHLLENGTDVKHVQELLGHKSMESTVIYTHFDVKSLRKIMVKHHPRENELCEPPQLTEDFIQSLPNNA